MGKILVIEHEERLRMAIMAYLKSQGADPIAITTMQEAVRILDKSVVDVVVLDLQLGNGTGLDVLRHIRESPTLADLPVLAMSAWEMEPAFYDYLEPGDYLLKPFDMRVLALTIRQILGLAEDQFPGPSGAALSKVLSPGVGGG